MLRNPKKINNVLYISQNKHQIEVIIFKSKNLYIIKCMYLQENAFICDWIVLRLESSKNKLAKINFI